MENEKTLCMGTFDEDSDWKESITTVSWHV